MLFIGNVLAMYVIVSFCGNMIQITLPWSVKKQAKLRVQVRS